MTKTADISECGQYRYSLTRTWDESLPRVCFVMLNPSTADANVDDPTIRKCIGFAKRWGCGGINVVNLYAWRATDPRELKGLQIGSIPENSAAIRTAMCELTVCAWGAVCPRKDLDIQVTRVLCAANLRGIALKCLGYSKNGHPRHPLMLAYATPLEEIK